MKMKHIIMTAVLLTLLLGLTNPVMAGLATGVQAGPDWLYCEWGIDYLYYYWFFFYYWCLYNPYQPCVPPGTG
jgi:hypothetical protein